MKTILKLLLAAIVINAAVRGGLAAKRYFEFKQAAQEAVLFGADTPVTDIRQIIVERARVLNVPITADDVKVNRQGGRTWADAAYHQSIEVFPNQMYPVNWSFSVEGYSMVLGATPVKK
jgi:hypothetical protein